MTLGAQCFVIDVVIKMTQNEHRCEIKCILLKQLLESSEKTSVHNVSTYKRRKLNLIAKLRCLLQMNKMNLGAQCFYLDMVIT